MTGTASGDYARSGARSNRTLKLILGVIAAVAVLAIGAALLPDAAPVKVSRIQAEFINPSTIKVMWTMDGEPGTTVDCRVKATDASHKYDGSDRALDIELNKYTGQHTSWIPLEIDHEGAAFVTDVTVEC